MAAAFFAFVAYGAKESYLFFYPGLFLLIWIRAGFKMTVYFGLVLLGMLFVETGIFNFLSNEYTFGRIEYLSGGRHTNEMRLKYEGMPYMELVSGRWLKLPAYDQFFSIIALMSVVYLVAARKLLRLDNASLGIVLVTISYALIVSFVPLSIDPLIPLQIPKVKYLTPLMPLVVYVAFLGIRHAMDFVPAAPARTVVVLVNVAAVAFLTYAVVKESPFTMRNRTNTYPQKNAFIWRYEEIHKAFITGHGVCVNNYHLRHHTIEFLTKFYYPPIPKGSMYSHRFDFGEKGKIRVLYHYFWDKDEVTQYIRPHEFRIIGDPENCGQW